jgi:hypothetical protein
MLRSALIALAAVASGCASAPEAAAPRTYALAGVTVRFMASPEVDRECEGRMRNGKPHWGCATYSRDSDSCELLVQPIRHKLDWDRAALVGIEPRNCLRIKSGEPDQ